MERDERGNDMSELKFRNLKNEEVPILSEYTYLSLYVPEGEKPFPKSIIEEPYIRKYYKDFDPEKELCCVAELEGSIVGVAWGRHFPEEHPGYGFYKDTYVEMCIAVKEGARNRGIGRKLIDGFIKAAKSAGEEGISLSVSYGNYAIDLYMDAGFRVMEKRKTDILMILTF